MTKKLSAVLFRIIERLANFYPAKFYSPQSGLAKLRHEIATAYKKHHS